MGLVTYIRMKLLNPVLRELAYRCAMLVYYIVRWRSDLLQNTDLNIITLMAIATEKRQPVVSSYFKTIVKMRDGING